LIATNFKSILAGINKDILKQFAENCKSELLGMEIYEDILDTISIDPIQIAKRLFRL